MSAQKSSDVHDFLNSDFIPDDINLDFAKDNQDDREQDEFDRLLDDFISQQLQETADEQEEILEAEKNRRPLKEKIKSENEFIGRLYNEERQLYDAFHNFCEAVKDLALHAEIEVPCFTFSAEQLYPRFRPSRGRLLSSEVITGWETLLRAQPVRLSSLPPQPSDEQLLEFAEKTTDESLQQALISYVEILIELEGCEICYNQRKARAQKRRIEKEIYEEHQRRKERIQKYISAIQEQKFPVDAERLVNNYFKTAKKDPDGALKMLENNPATFAPIQIENIEPRFFGMIKPKPEDGIRVNKEIGKFLKNLKV